MKVAVIVGARPQFVKAAVVSRAFASRPGVTEVLIHTGQHFDRNMSDVFFEELGIRAPDYSLGVGGGSHAENTGRAMEAIEKVLLRESPDYVLVYGDTDSTLAGALAAGRAWVRARGGRTIGTVPRGTRGCGAAGSSAQPVSSAAGGRGVAGQRRGRRSAARFVGGLVSQPGESAAGQTTAGQRVVSQRAGQPQRARLTAERTARMEAPVVSASTPTPHRVPPSISTSTYAAACASDPADRACSV